MCVYFFPSFNRSRSRGRQDRSPSSGQFTRSRRELERPRTPPSRWSTRSRSRSRSPMERRYRRRIEPTPEPEPEPELEPGQDLEMDPLVVENAWFEYMMEDTNGLDDDEEVAPRTKMDFSCEVCNVSVSSMQALQTHFAGAKHQKKLRQGGLSTDLQDLYRDDLDPAVKEKVFRCVVCDVVLTGNEIKVHVKGLRHQTGADDAGVESEDAFVEVDPGTYQSSSSSTIKTYSTRHEHHCSLCGVTLHHWEIFQKHLQGKRHQKLLKWNEPNEEVKGEIAGQQQFWCNICGIFCTNKDSLDGHLTGKKHYKMLKSKGIPIPTTDAQESSASLGQPQTKPWRSQPDSMVASQKRKSRSRSPERLRSTSGTRSSHERRRSHSLSRERPRSTSRTRGSRERPRSTSRTRGSRERRRSTSRSRGSRERRRTHSHSRSPVTTTSRDRWKSRSRSPVTAASRDRWKSRSRSPVTTTSRDRWKSRSRSPAATTSRDRWKSRSRSPAIKTKWKSRSRSRSPITTSRERRSRSHSPVAVPSHEKQKSHSPGTTTSREKLKSHSDSSKHAKSKHRSHRGHKERRHSHSERKHSHKSSRSRKSEPTPESPPSPGTPLTEETNVSPKNPGEYQVLERERKVISQKEEVESDAHREKPESQRNTEVVAKESQKLQEGASQTESTAVDKGTPCQSPQREGSSTPPMPPSIAPVAQPQLMMIPQLPGAMPQPLQPGEAAHSQLVGQPQFAVQQSQLALALYQFAQQTSSMAMFGQNFQQMTPTMTFLQPTVQGAGGSPSQPPFPQMALFQNPVNMGLPQSQTPGQLMAPQAMTSPQMAAAGGSRPQLMALQSSMQQAHLQPLPLSSSGPQIQQQPPMPLMQQPQVPFMQQQQPQVPMMATAQPTSAAAMPQPLAPAQPMPPTAISQPMSTTSGPQLPVIQQHPQMPVMQQHPQMPVVQQHPQMPVVQQHPQMPVIQQQPQMPMMATAHVPQTPAAAMPQPLPALAPSQPLPAMAMSQPMPGLQSGAQVTVSPTRTSPPHIFSPLPVPPPRGALSQEEETRAQDQEEEMEETPSTPLMDERVPPEPEPEPQPSDTTLLREALAQPSVTDRGKKTAQSSSQPDSKRKSDKPTAKAVKVVEQHIRCILCNKIFPADRTQKHLITMEHVKAVIKNPGIKIHEILIKV